MGYTDKMCNDIAKKIINEIFLIKYNPTIVEGKPWYENLNNFIVKEWGLICYDAESDEEDNNELSEQEEEEQNQIISNSMDILCDKLDVDEDEWENHEEDVDWGRFDEIISRYISMVDIKYYDKDCKEITN